MLPLKPDPVRVALNRVTFGARSADVDYANEMGWPAWANEQLNSVDNNDPVLGAHLMRQTMRIRYNAPAANDTRGTWQAVDEDRPLTHIFPNTAALWQIARNAGGSVSPAERLRIRQELAAATWIRNTHARHQIREFMTDFWHNHFNIGKNENELATALLPVFDLVVIRMNALGNFRTLLGATATSGAMLIYLDNWVSGATTPNENYAREIMELHTLGGGAYLGTVNQATVPKDMNGVAAGFTDQDVIEASRIMSGWTVQYGQRGAGTENLPNTGEFAFNPRQHNQSAASVLGVSLHGISSGTAQGEKFLDVIAAHPATATFIVTKLARRIFGDTPPQAVIDRAVAAWKLHQAAPDQIAQVLRAILLDGPEIMTAPVVKVRRPYERVIALARTTGMVVNAGTFMTSLMDPFNDGLFAWQAPNGRPDANTYWLATGATVGTWNLLFQIPALREFSSAPLADQSPLEVLNTANGIVEYWVGRMVGYQLNQGAMDRLVLDQAGSSGIPAAVRTNNVSRIETAHRRLVSLIAASEEFSLR
jgi:uncharacterized protein (DUF1800 family)